MWDTVCLLDAFYRLQQHGCSWRTHLGWTLQCASRCCFQRQYRLSPWLTFAKVYLVCICSSSCSPWITFSKICSVYIYNSCCRSRSMLTFFMFIHVIQPWNRYLSTFSLLTLSTFSPYIGNFLSKPSCTDSYWNGSMVPIFSTMKCYLYAF